MNKQNMEVLTNVIGAVESGGQIYGKRNYAAYAAPYTNSNVEYTITLGWAQNYGAEARKLVQMIYDADPEGFKKIDSSGSIKAMLAKDWVAIKWKPTAAQKKVLISLITSDAGKKCQDELFAQLMKKFISECEKNYSKDVQVIMMYCEIRHLGGAGPVKRIFDRISGTITLDKIMASLVKDQRDTSNDNQVGDAKFWSRHMKCKEFIEQYAVSEEKAAVKKEEVKKVAKTRAAIVALAKSWKGKKESDGSHREIIDIYNSYKPHPRGYALQYSDAWCAGTASALAIKLGYTDIIPVECSCFYWVEHAKAMGIWVENDAYVPKEGDFVLYDWSDSGSGDNTAAPDHIGIVTKAGKTSFTVTEGNKNNAVGDRTMQVNGRYIRGFVCPKYDETGSTSKDTSTAKKSVATLAKEVLDGKWGNGDDRKQRLTAAGYDYAAVQAKVNELLKTGSSTTQSTGGTISKARSSSKFTVTGDGTPNKTEVFVGKVTANVLNVRSWAGISNPNIRSYPQLANGNLVSVCDSILANDKSEWYYVKIANKYYGFVSAKYITRA